MLLCYLSCVSLQIVGMHAHVQRWGGYAIAAMVCNVLQKLMIHFEGLEIDYCVSL